MSGEKRRPPVPAPQRTGTVSTLATLLTESGERHNTCFADSGVDMTY